MHEHTEKAEAQFWTCSMHPQIQQSQAGQCPICGMDLVPVDIGDAQEAGPRVFTTTEEAKALMDIETAPVARKFVTAVVRMVGKVNYDETRLAEITAWVPGRLDRLFVDYTGIAVRKGDHMVEIYSPELLTAQEELRQALAAVNRLRPESPGVLRDTAEATLDAARRRLRLWGLTHAQISQAEKTGDLPDRITIYAPVGGTVIQRAGQEGMYVERGTRIYTIADLSRVWIELDAYESDLPWLRYGQHVEITAGAYPGEVFEGQISFIEPFLDDVTRTVKVRANVENPTGKLKPAMFVRGTVRAQVASGGRVMEPALAGKWISPMHPEIVKDGPGTCDVCGMPLVRAEELGYVSAEAGPSEKPLVIPVTAALVTGTRAVVYVEVMHAESPTFEGREVVLGPRAGDYYIVRGGLSEDERVVINGNFKIDSALQILAKPSMMGPGSGLSPAHEHESPGMKMEAPAMAPAADSAPPPAAFEPLLDSYYRLQEALAKDDGTAAASAVGGLKEAAKAFAAGIPEGDANEVWRALAEALEKPVSDAAAASSDLRNLRPPFSALTEAIVDALRAAEMGEASPVNVLRCPMAFDNRGALWLQADGEVRNPYFGAAMLRCGEVIETLGSGGKAEAHE